MKMVAIAYDTISQVVVPWVPERANLWMLFQTL